MSNYPRRMLVLPVVLVTALMLVLFGAIAQATTSPDEQYEEETGGPPGGKIGICHATGSASNPYVYVEVPEGSAAHDDHLADIRGVDGPEDCPGPVETTDPEVTDPEVTDPELTDPELTDPELTDPELTDPEMTDPEMTDPEMTDPEMTDPEMTDPEMTDPEMTDPEMTDPEVTSTPPPDEETTLLETTIDEEPVVSVGLSYLCTRPNENSLITVTNSGDEAVRVRVSSLTSSALNLAPGETATVKIKVSQGSGYVAATVDGETVASINVVRESCGNGPNPENPNPENPDGPNQGNPDRPNAENPDRPNAENPGGPPVVNIPADRTIVSGPGPDLSVVGCQGVVCEFSIPEGSEFTLALVDLDEDGVIAGDELASQAQKVAQDRVVASAENGASNVDASVLPETGGAGIGLLLAALALFAGSGIMTFAILRR